MLTEVYLHENLFQQVPFCIFAVVNYGLGGQYNTHPDAFGVHNPLVQSVATRSPEVMQSGDRVMTLMIYLSSVQLGGGTAFPVAGMRTDAVEGDAILWKNMFLDTGAPDPTTLHGGCPVAVGSKWVTNKWIHMYDQHESYPCPIQEGDIGQSHEMNIIQHWRSLNN